MKNLLIFCFVIMAASCSKSEFNDVTDPNLPNEKLYVMEYGPMVCELKGGECGSQCAGNAGGCWMETKCKPNPVRFNDVLKSKYTAEQIELMKKTSTPIIDAELLSILKEEGKLPLK